jgi:exonuclease VII small subunit
MTRAAKVAKVEKSRSEVSLEDRVADLERKVSHMQAMQKALDASVEKLERMLERWAKMR